MREESWGLRPHQVFKVPKYLESACGPIVSEEDWKKKRMSQRDEKQEQDKEAEEGETGHNSVKWSSKRRLWGWQ